MHRRPRYLLRGSFLGDDGLPPPSLSLSFPSSVSRLRLLIAGRETEISVFFELMPEDVAIPIACEATSTGLSTNEENVCEPINDGEASKLRARAFPLSLLREEFIVEMKSMT